LTTAVSHCRGHAPKRDGIRIIALVALPLALLGAPLSAGAQKSEKGARIGYLRSGSMADAMKYGEALRQGLRELGYVENQNLTIETRAADGRAERLPGLAGELLRLPVDIIVAGGTSAIRAAKEVTSTVPIVMAVSTDPVGAGLVSSLARPGGNVTGLALGAGEQFAGKWVELLKEIVPGASRVAALWDPLNVPQALSFVRAAETATQAAGLRFQQVQAHHADELHRAFAAMRGVEALIVLPSAQFNAERKRIAELAARHRLPTIYEHREFVDAGGLVSYGPNLPAVIRRAAYYVDRILKGARPADLPVEQPRQFELILSRKAARALGLTLSPSLLSRADEIID
jgi:putative ABC transport system substrate-binding protein